MGQQVPFETIEQVALRLAEAARHRGWLREQPSGALVTAEMDVDVTADGERRTPRATLSLQPDSGRPPVTLDVFEGYWAPMTEGRVGLGDVVRFLWIGARNGLRQALAAGRAPLSRWMFGGPTPLDAPRGVGAAVLGVCVVLASVAVLLGLTTFAAGVRGLGGLGFAMSWPSARGAAALTGVLGLYELVSLLLLGPLGVLLLVRRRWLRRARAAKRVWAPGESRTWRVWTRLAAAAVAAWYGATVLAAVWATGCAFVDGWAAVVVQALGLGAQPPGWWAMQLLIWAGMVGLGLVVRRFVVQYLGDVAVYITPHALDRFHEIRRAVKQAVRTAVSAVYEAEEDGRPRYDAVLLAGHSLGSVVIYDALNALLLRDAELEGADQRSGADQAAAHVRLAAGQDGLLLPAARAGRGGRPRGAGGVAAAAHPELRAPHVSLDKCPQPARSHRQRPQVLRPASRPRRPRESASRTCKTLTRCCRSRPTPSIGTTPPSPTPSSTRSRG